jgi:hypothetical protein
MNFIESISNYILENITTKDLPKVGIIALNESLESESIYILAGMNVNDNLFEINQYFENSINELKIKLPTKIEAAKILTRYYLKQIVENPEKAFELMVKLDNDVYKQIDWNESNNKYIGEELKIEKLYTWYRENQDWNDNNMILYYNELSREDQRKKFEEHLVEEAEITLKNNYS